MSPRCPYKRGPEEKRDRLTQRSRRQTVGDRGNPRVLKDAAIVCFTPQLLEGVWPTNTPSYMTAGFWI